MRKLRISKGARIALAALAVIILVFGVEMLAAMPGPDDHFHNPSRQPVPFTGVGKPIVYVVMGDSTAAGRGGDYARGIAMETARHLARTHSVVMVNLGISGAKTGEVLRDQLPSAIRLHPDIVLLSVGANDATHFTSDGALKSQLTRILDRLQASDYGVQIVLTGSPDLGTVPRFAQPLRWLAGIEAKRVNRIFDGAGRARHVTLAPIARDTGPFFAKDRRLFAPDRFHPNERGYATWIPVLDVALDKALRQH